MILSDLDNIVYNKFANGEITLAEYIKYQNRDKIMKYEEKYKQALERAKKFAIDGYLDAIAVDDIFPELKENEDERIRKKLICFVENWKNFNPNSPFDDYAVYTSDRDECDRILAWLEKQKPNTRKREIDDAYLQGICDAKHEIEKQGKK